MYTYIPISPPYPTPLGGHNLLGSSYIAQGDQLGALYTSFKIHSHGLNKSLSLSSISSSVNSHWDIKSIDVLKILKCSKICNWCGLG